MKWSMVYRYSVNPEVFLDAENIENLRRKLAFPEADDAGSGELCATLARAVCWRGEQLQKFVRLVDGTEEVEEKSMLVKALLIHSAPMASILGCWLQGMSAPGVFEDRMQLRVMALLADDVGVGQPGASRYDEFKALLKRFDLQEYAVHPYELSHAQLLDDSIYGLPAVLLAMSRRSDFFGPEILGIDIVFRTIGLMPCWDAIRRDNAACINWDRLNLSISRNPAVVEDPLAASMEIAGYYRSARLLRAAQWALAALDKWSDSLERIARNSVDPHQAMARLIQQRARDASAYHQSYQLGGCPLSDRFVEAMHDPEPLMQALARSPLIKPGLSSKSVLVNGMVGSRGKMFRVFREDELATVRRWIDHLSQASGTEPDFDKAEGTQPGTCSIHAVTPGDMDIGAEPRNIRDAYHVLQGRALGPRTRRFAVEYVRNWMSRARQSKGDCEKSLPKVWPQEGLRGWLSDMHERSSRTYQESAERELPTREEVIDSTLQLAPLICIDGAWLQGFTDMHLASSPVGFSLFEIYWDELGNGRIELNHPKIYRDLLRQMGIELAAIGSREFAQDPRLRHASFQLPVLWLCLGKLPLTFMPEILGMNLAMELSGVGNEYQFASRFLRHYGYSTHFVDLHNTIDNVATGHSSWAVDGIDRYMRRLMRDADDSVASAEWDRIRTGFKSLTTTNAGSNSWNSWNSWFRNLVSAVQAKRERPSDEDSRLFHHV